MSDDFINFFDESLPEVILSVKGVSKLIYIYIYIKFGVVWQKIKHVLINCCKNAAKIRWLL